MDERRTSAVWIWGRLLRAAAQNARTERFENPMKLHNEAAKLTMEMSGSREL